jgi:hypothetical protein
MQVADRRDRATAGSGGQRRGAGRARQRDVALTRAPVAQCTLFNSFKTQ